jgi:hypothetical protein
MTRERKKKKKKKKKKKRNRQNQSILFTVEFLEGLKEDGQIVVDRFKGLCCNPPGEKNVEGLDQEEQILEVDCAQHIFKHHWGEEEDPVS